MPARLVSLHAFAPRGAGNPWATKRARGLLPELHDDRVSKPDLIFVMEKGLPANLIANPRAIDPCAAGRPHVLYVELVAYAENSGMSSTGMKTWYHDIAVGASAENHLLTLQEVMPLFSVGSRDP
jgi:hypothetical protein